jgi:site-specific DNA-cytosine methylase
MTFVASLTGRQGRNGDGSEETFIAAPLSHGSNPNSNMAGRRREDDENLVSFDAEFSNQGEPHELDTLTRKLKRAVSSEATGVRRLTPCECERLQALPDDWTAHGPDSRRYAALGDAVTASVAEWIGRRIIVGAAA